MVQDDLHAGLASSLDVASLYSRHDRNDEEEWQLLSRRCVRPLRPVIDDALSAMAVSSSAPEGALAQTFHVHKGACDDAVSASLGGMHGSEELATHLLQLVRNSLQRIAPQQLKNLVQWLQDDERGDDERGRRAVS
jgi:hypothetical protein